jgi:hypothetical protein
MQNNEIGGFFIALLNSVFSVPRLSARISRHNPSKDLIYILLLLFSAASASSASLR